MRVMFNYIEALGSDSDVLAVLRKALPKANKCGVDLKVPTEESIAKSVSSLRVAPWKYQVLYLLVKLFNAVQG
jgi:intergrase/recombinase